eukprot:3569916-Pyramimonas_sp.AAC.1
MLGGAQVLLVSSYAICSVGVADNVELIASLLEAVRAACLPFIIAGGRNLEAAFVGRDSFLRAGFLSQVHAEVVHSGKPTCHDSHCDFFVISDVLLSFVKSISVLEDTPAGPHKAVKLALGGLGGQRYIYRRVKPDPFPMPQTGQSFVPGDVSSWPGFNLEEGESVDSLARRWFQSAELYLCMRLAIPASGWPRYCGRELGCRLEKVPLACEWGKSLRRKASPLDSEVAQHQAFNHAMAPRFRHHRLCPTGVEGQCRESS